MIGNSVNLKGMSSVLVSVKAIGRQLGAGSYGTVEEVCARCNMIIYDLELTHYYLL